MVARINTSKSLSKVLNYNEHKVREKEAELLLAQNFLKDASQLSFSDKTKHFERFTSLNERATTNTLHVSLNFDVTEKLSNDALTTIAKTYMDKIGFGEQPYLVYRHHDAGHPHIHIVSTNIQHDGNRLSMHNIGRNQSEKARVEIENEFGLVKAQEKKMDDRIKLVPVSAQKVAYGKASTKRAISNVLGLVVNDYKYSSLAELNAILKLYHVQADRGEKDSLMFEKRGLVYRVIDESGTSISPPLKASSFYMKPTLKNLEHRFTENEKLKQPFAKRIKSAIDFALLEKSTVGLEQLTKALGRENITMVLRQNKEGLIYGMTYVDHKTKCVFNGSDIGKGYSANAILKRVVPAISLPGGVAVAGEKKNTRQVKEVAQETTPSGSKYPEIVLSEADRSTAGMPDYVPWQLKKRKRGKKKKRINL
ncbi:MAG: relaxase/mobilization nuclease domain-containing protein [Chitinophagaceae bacterium]|nr:relaxase/mobilization nuclease domain-containing protein [Chitinophagaceae bacterium]